MAAPRMRRLRGRHVWSTGEGSKRNQDQVARLLIAQLPRSLPRAVRNLPQGFGLGLRWLHLFFGHNNSTKTTATASCMAQAFLNLFLLMQAREFLRTKAIGQTVVFKVLSLSL